VLVNGATGTAGGLAVQIAKHLGAATVIATGRNIATLESLRSRGADTIINLTDDAHRDQALRDTFAGGVDVVLDYLWGPSAEAILAVASATSDGGRPVRFIQVGTTSAPTITLPGAPLHSSAIEIKGSGIGSVQPTAISQILRGLLNAAPAAGFQVATRPLPLTDVETAWTTETASPRIVFTVTQ
jgi:NADPH:quinone reductase-like Zn-dependent oxidoreductase